VPPRLLVIEKSRSQFPAEPEAVKLTSTGFAFADVRPPNSVKPNKTPRKYDFITPSKE
jgi:hypothetical protein